MINLRMCLIVGAAAAGVSAQPAKPTLTAREIFYRPVAPAAAAKKAETKTASAAKTVAKAQTPKAPKTEERQPAGSSSTSVAEGAQLVNASYSAGPLRPLGLRYSLLRLNGDSAQEVGADTVFRSGDKIRVALESNDRAYLYIVMKGTSGSWKLLFPSQEINNGDNRVEPGRPYMIPPPPSRFAFDETAGEEKLFIVLSRQPEPDFEKLIYSLSGVSEPAPAAAPERRSPQRPQVFLAQNLAIEDALIAKTRNRVYARDLVFEKVDENTPGDRKETATYVVNTKTSPDARLVVDLKLTHR